MSMRCSAEAGAYATPNQPIQTGKLQATCWHDSAKSGILVGSSRAVNVLTCSPASPFKNSRSDHQCPLHIAAYYSATFARKCQFTRFERQKRQKRTRSSRQITHQEGACQSLGKACQ
jgi:hypothetical protein